MQLFFLSIPRVKGDDVRVGDDRALRTEPHAGFSQQGGVCSESTRGGQQGVCRVSVSRVTAGGPQGGVRRGSAGKGPQGKVRRGSAGGLQGVRRE
eukprot:5296689-Pyramimonas_sp.AAC.1